MSRFPPGFSIQWPREASLTTAFSRPGSAISAVRLSMLFVDPAFFGFLALGEPRERTGGHIIGDDRSRRNPSVVANADRSIEDIVDAGPDVPPDRRLRLRNTRLVLEIRGHAAGADVRARADLGVADVGQMWDFRPRADRRFLDLDEGPDLRAPGDGSAWPHVGERSDLHAGRDPHVAADHGVGMDRHVGLDLDAGLDPGRR